MFKVKYIKAFSMFCIFSPVNSLVLTYVLYICDFITTLNKHVDNLMSILFIFNVYV